MGKCKKDVTPVCEQWSYVFHVLTHQNVLYLQPVDTDEGVGVLSALFSNNCE